MIPVRAYLRLLRRYLRPLRRRVALLTVLLGAGIACQAINPQLIRAFLDRASSGGALGGLLTLAGGFTALAVGHQVLNVAATYVAEQVGWRATNELRADLAEHVLHLDMGFHKGHTPGELIERIDGDVTTLSEFFASFVIRVLGNLVLVVSGARPAVAGEHLGGPDHDRLGAAGAGRDARHPDGGPALVEGDAGARAPSSSASWASNWPAPRMCGPAAGCPS